MALKMIKTTIEVVDYKDLAKKLDLLGITRMCIAKDLNISPSMLSRWTTGKQFVPDNKVDELNEYIDRKSKEALLFWDLTSLNDDKLNKIVDMLVVQHGYSPNSVIVKDIIKTFKEE